MHPCAAPVVRLERPLALGHGCLSLCVWPSRHHPQLRVSTMAVGKLIRLARNRRGSLGRSRRTDDRSGFAAVPPTFGRLFEGTDVFALGQTWSFRRSTGPEFSPSQATLAPAAPSVRNLYCNVAERLAPRDKTVSFLPMPFPTGTARDDEARTPGPPPPTDNADHQLAPQVRCESNPRRGAARLPGEDSRPVHICG